MATYARTQSLRSRRVHKRLLYHHLTIATVSGIAVLLIVQRLAGERFIFRMSMATAYAALALLGATLILGPLNKLRARPNPVSTDLRRDIGIWAGLLGLAHVLIGLQVHLGGRFWWYFLHPSSSTLGLPIRIDRFGFANDTGLAATMILLLLLTLSNDRSLRALKSARWKALQRLNYGAFALVVLHAITYQNLERRSLGFVLIFGATVAVVIAVRLAALRRRARTAGVMRE